MSKYEVILTKFSDTLQEFMEIDGYSTKLLSDKTGISKALIVDG